ncbi:CvpA family protein [Sphingomonas sp. RHCKR47]|jgi:membrane protein required for colicin V production|uniref:CvpA family protein n=1 Tax=Sphingomonas citricola TaxID=2862498 RepID=UPI001C68382E|nr:CvpA family protein [Sphingomonas citricola]MBW6523658.1 CvpA family protein [Sphingomonas citricola]
MNLHALDIVVLLLVAATALLGAKRGFVAEVLALFAWVAMIFALKIFHLPLSRALAPTIGTASGATVLAFAILTGGTYLLSRIVVNAVSARTRTSILGPIDRALGFGFGALKGLIFASLAFLLIVLVLDLLGGGPARRPAWINQARTYPLLSATSASIADVVDRRRRGKPLFAPRWQRVPQDNGTDTP